MVYQYMHAKYPKQRIFVALEADLCQIWNTGYIWIGDYQNFLHMPWLSTASRLNFFAEVLQEEPEWMLKQAQKLDGNHR